MFGRKTLLVAMVATLLFPLESDGQLFKGRANRRANRNPATTVQAPVANTTCRFDPITGKCIVHPEQAGATAASSDPEMDAYMAHLYGAVPDQETAPAVAPAVPKAETKVDAKTALSRANAKLRMLNERALKAEAAAEAAMVEAELARTQQMDALVQSIEETTRAKKESGERYDAQIEKMLEQLADLENS